MTKWMLILSALAFALWTALAWGVHALVAGGGDWLGQWLAPALTPEWEALSATALMWAERLGVLVVWAVGALASGPLHLGRAHTRAGADTARPVVQSLALGALLLAVFLAGGLVVARIPLLRNPVEELLDHARLGSVALVAVITAVNGCAEELYFRGALYAAVGRRHAVLLTTTVYALTTVGAGLELDSSAYNVFITRTRLVGRYVFGNNVSGFSVGLAVSF